MDVAMVCGVEYATSVADKATPFSVHSLLSRLTKDLLKQPQLVVSIVSWE